MLTCLLACLLAYLQVNRSEISAIFGATSFVGSLAPVVVYSVCIEIMPILVPTLARQCRWDNPAHVRTHMTMGYYVGRVTGLLVLGLSELGMLLMWETAVQGVAAGANASSGSAVLFFNQSLASALCLAGSR